MQFVYDRADIALGKNSHVGVQSILTWVWLEEPFYFFSGFFDCHVFSSARVQSSHLEEKMMGHQGLLLTMVTARILLVLQRFLAVVDDHFVICKLHMPALMLLHSQSHKKCVCFHGILCREFLSLCLLSLSL